MKYSDQLLDPRWQRKRLEILQRDNFTCKKCGDTEINLQIHHIEYEYSKMAWEVPDDKLDTLCMHCHEIVGELGKLRYDSIIIKTLERTHNNRYLILLSKSVIAIYDCNKSQKIKSAFVLNRRQIDQIITNMDLSPEIILK